MMHGKWRGQTRLSTDLTNHLSQTEPILRNRKWLIVFSLLSIVRHFVPSIGPHKKKVLSSFFRVLIMCAACLLVFHSFYCCPWKQSCCSLFNEKNITRSWNYTKKGMTDPACSKYVDTRLWVHLHMIVEHVIQKPCTIRCFFKCLQSSCFGLFTMLWNQPAGIWSILAV